MAVYTAIDNPELYFQIKLYTGDGSTPSITLDGDTDMQPDMVWIKNRDAADTHCAFDAVRGVTEVLHTDATTAETTDADTLTSFDSDGFALGADVKVNTDTEAYVAWCWKAGTTSGISVDGNETIAPSSYSFNQTSGFSITAFTGDNASSALIPHGLGAVPEFMVVKNRDYAKEWITYHHKMHATAPEDYKIQLNDTGVPYNWEVFWNDTAPNAYNFSVGSDISVNDAYAYVTYLWRSVQGFSKFGSYEGNGDANGAFVYTGFRPAWVMTKSADSTSSWHMFDNKREGYNVDNDPLVAEATTVEATTDMIDLLSNGFKFRIATDPNVAETYVYMAFAEAPFVNSNGVPCNAR